MESRSVRWWVPATGERGVMLKTEMQKAIQGWEVLARQVLAQCAAPHVVYAAKLYDADGDLEEVRFFEHPATDVELDVASRAYGMVYAVHRL